MSNHGKTKQVVRKRRPLSAAERSFVKAFARWKARADYDDWCTRQPKDRSATGAGGRVRTCDLSRATITSTAALQSMSRSMNSPARLRTI